MGVSERSTPLSEAPSQPLTTAPERAPIGKPKVIYVMGAGHSGSTILGVALGNCSDSFYAGEVDEWLINGGMPGVGGTERGEFWAQVRERMRDSEAEQLFGGVVNRAIERSSSLLRPDAWLRRRALRRRYREVADALLRAIAGTAGVTHVVDTSHFPLRARELQRSREVELYLVLLVRDPQDVVASNVRELRRHELAERRVRIFATNLDLWLTHLLSTVVFLRHPRARRVFVTHEAFLADPEGTMEQIVRALGTGTALPDMGALRAGVALEGNAMISRETVAVRRSVRKVERWSGLTSLMQACWGPVFARLRPVAVGGAQAAGAQAGSPGTEAPAPGTESAERRG
ncbi:MAG TPA: sulfotransferase [Solirubrobacteraceae bacterium]|nr:sulfotransferase [Solirubrobacteraceae bacterium]